MHFKYLTKVPDHVVVCKSAAKMAVVFLSCHFDSSSSSLDHAMYYVVPQKGTIDNTAKQFLPSN